MSAAFVVTTGAQGRTRTQIWDAANPLPVGHPFEWIIEKTETGVRIRNLAPRFHEIQQGGVCEIPHSTLEKGLSIELPLFSGKSSISFSIKKTQPIDPLYGNKSGNHLSVFSCLGNWVLSSTPINEKYLAKIGMMSVFEITKTGKGYFIHSLAEGLKLGEKTFAKGEKSDLDSEKLAETVFTLGSHYWRFGFAQTMALPNTAKKTDTENLWFKKTLRYSGLALICFSLLTWIWPKPDEKKEELIPPQFTKLVMTKTKQAASSGSQSVASEKTGTLPKKVQEAAVVQAFRAKALNSAVSGLLKGGMTHLLAQSDFVMGKEAAQNAKRVFDAHTDALRPTGPNAGLSADRNIAVASLGGAASGANGKGIGYGKGEHAGVKGQGNAFVSMDIGDSSVEDGLTKDEVGAVIHRHLSEVRYCYESAMIRTPELEGKLMVGFTIGGKGFVKTTEVKNSTLQDPRLDDCILRRLVTWKFPEPKGGIDVAVSYPFIFKSLGR